jgi:Domain of unknown function (DUF2341)
MMTRDTWLGMLVVLALVAPAGNALAWWNCDWDYRFPVTISRPPGAPVSDYQVRVDLSAASVPAQFDWALQGSDLRVIDQDDATAVSFFIEQWNVAAQTAVIWVRVPTLPPAGRTLYFYFGAPIGTPSASTAMTFTEPGLKFHTRMSTANPNGRAAAEAAFDAANDSNPGYGCTFVNAYTNLSNVGVFAPPNRNSNIGLFAEVFFDVAPAEAGLWQFRYGADFGYGGGLYVDDVVLEEDWANDLWWNFNWNAASEVLQGSINLAAGTHSLRIIGFEDCCDGGLTVEFQRPGGPWLPLSLANIPLESRKCPTIQTTVSFGAGEASTCPALTITHNVQPLSDPVHGTTNPKSIPGAIVQNRTIVRNSGTGPVDANTVIIAEIVPPDMSLSVADFDGSTAGPVRFTDGTPASGLTYTFVALGDMTDDVEFSNDNGASYGYVPVPDGNGLDAAVTHFRIRPKNVLLGNSGSGDRVATFDYKLQVK